MKHRSSSLRKSTHVRLRACVLCTGTQRSLRVAECKDLQAGRVHHVLFPACGLLPLWTVGSQALPRGRAAPSGTPQPSTLFVSPLPAGPRSPQRPPWPGLLAVPPLPGADTHPGEQAQGQGAGRGWLAGPECHLSLLSPRDALDLSDIDSEPPRGSFPSFEPRNLLSLFEDSLDPTWASGPT